MNNIAIETKGLSKQYDRDLAVCDVDLKIETGEVYGLIGPNGAGKTTLIQMLAGIIEPTVGEVYWFEEKVKFNTSHFSLKRRLGYLPDDFPLYDDLTVYDYLEYFGRLYFLRQPQLDRRLQEVLELLQLTSKRHSLISTLSRGMQQRLSLARTIIHEPILLLLDEPVSGLDPLSRQQFREMIKVLQEAGMTILISSHVLSDLAEICTSIGIMDLGYLVESTSLQQLYQRFPEEELVISVLDNLEQLANKINDFKEVESYQIIAEENKIKVQFTGSEQEKSDLLRSLLNEGFSIADFRTEKPNLEQVFLKLDHQQPS
ncbi:ABC transporter ATP-binding protein [Euhalothece natronophila Z-M001]|uniref:ABC transporter ATP-binding protein n=1 Tax=Euhalothece natronophila Z-M001 TaxID=522448 RepID=A0A5B8NMF6_9CHRO|nr:ABC transporter ATP-binding protein [Euhalothece natronophila]QDZ39470.1 ABC transporter ATP-binding protein [Euhalothece natronophila Z-M001]